MLTNSRGRPYNEPVTEFGAFIRHRRKELGLTQPDLAKKAGLSSGAISMIETGERSDLRVNTVLRLARALDVTADDLLGRMDAVLA